MAVPYTFGSATAAIPLSQLDSNFASTITLGNTAIQLGNTVTILNNMTFANVTVSSGTVSVTTVTATTANLVTINASTLNAATHRSDSSLVLQTNGTTTAVTIDTAQNVGVGVTPSAWGSIFKALEVGRVGSSITAVSATGNLILTGNAYQNSGGNWTYANTGSYAGLFQVRPSDGSFTWNIAASGTAGNTISFTQAMTLDPSGNLLVGTTSGSSSARAVIRREDLTSTTKAANTIAKLGPGTGTSRDANIILSDFAAYDYYFGGRGGVAYVTVNNNQGVQLSAGATSWSSDSDETLKDVIEPIKNAIDAVNSWRTVIGKYKSDDEGIRRVFFMAQDIQATTPEAVDLSPEGTLLLRYQDTIPVLAAAIKEQQTLITQLQADVAALKG